MAVLKNAIAFETAYDTYSADGIIGQGGAARVFSALDGDGSAVAIKLLNTDAASTDKRKRFKNELGFLQKASHPNLVQILDHGVSVTKGATGPFYVMPRYDGSLRDLMAAKIAPDKVLEIFAQLLDGVEAAHLLGVVHRDIKPENVLFMRKGAALTLAIADFGVARIQPDTQETMVETTVASRLANFAYAAPEQKTRGGVVDHRCDIFALGQMLNEMFTGIVPHAVGYKTIGSVVPDLAYVDHIVEYMIQNDPASRYSDIGRVKTELIARGLAYVAAQRLDEQKRAVIPENVPRQIDEVKLVSVDWVESRLVLTLNRVPEPRWVTNFHNPRGSWGHLMGSGPENFEFRGNVASVYAREQDAQQIIDFAKEYMRMATVTTQADVEAFARNEDKKRRDALATALEAAEQRARVLEKLRI